MNGNGRKPVFLLVESQISERASGFFVFYEGGMKMDVNVCVLGKTVVSGSMGQAVYIDTGGMLT